MSQRSFDLRAVYLWLYIASLLMGRNAFSEITIDPTPITRALAKYQYHEEKFAKDLGIKMLGFIISQNDPHKSVALIKLLDGGKVIGVKPGDFLVIYEKYNVLAIENSLLILLQQDSNQTIAAFADGFAAPVREKVAPVVVVPKASYSGSFREDGFERKDDQLTMSEAYRGQILNDISKIIMQMSTEPMLDKEGNMIGFMLDQIEPNSVFEKGGLQNGDVVRSINNIELENAQNTIKLLQSLKGQTEIRAVILRGGQEFPVTLNIK